MAPTMSAMTLASWMFICTSAFCMCCTARLCLRRIVSRWRTQLAQHAHRVAGAERTPQQAVAHELLQPLAVQHVGLAARDVLDVARVDQQHREAA